MPRSSQRLAARTPFDRFAETSSRFVGRGPFFAVSVVLILAWMPTIFVFRSVDTWQLVINTATSVLAFLLVALLQNSEQRSDAALHRKLDVLAAGMADLMQHGGDTDRETLIRCADELRSAVGLEERI